MKKFALFVSTIVSLLLMTVSASAMTLTPASGTFPVSQNQVISIKAAPPGPSSAFQLRLTVNDAKVVSYSGPGGTILAIGTCDSNGASFRAISSNKYEVCVDLASTGSDLPSGASLGTLTITSIDSSSTTFNIVGESENGYLLNTSDLSPSSGVFGSYAFATPGGNSGTSNTSPTSVPVLPDTAISDYMPTKGILGAVILISGIVSLSVALKVFLVDKRSVF